jgi:uncharacterized Zn finger protein
MATIKDYTGACPKCGSNHITGEEFESGIGEAWQTLICDDCGTIWREVYTFAFAEQDDD